MQQRFRFRDDVSVTETDYGMALLDGATGEYWTLNPSGVVVMRHLMDGGDLESATGALTARFDVDEATAAADAKAVVAELRAARIVTTA